MRPASAEKRRVRGAEAIPAASLMASEAGSSFGEKRAGWEAAVRYVWK